MDPFNCTMSSEKNFFWHGILSLNDLGEHAFFDVKIRKNVPGAPNIVGIYTDDIPPLPMSASDIMNVTFLLENNVGLRTLRYLVAESHLEGVEFMQFVSEKSPESGTVTVTTKSGEWVFMEHQQTWILRSILAYVPLAQLRKYIKDP